MLRSNTRSHNSFVISDPINVHISDFGCYQVVYWLFISVTKFSSAWVILGHIFLAAKTVYKCTEPSDEEDPCSENCEKADFDRTIFEDTIDMTFNLVCQRHWLSSFSQMMVWFGIMVGSIVFGTLADRFGRRITFNLASLMQFVLGVLVAFAPCFTSYVILKWLLSFATGGQMTIGFVLVIELIGASKLEAMSFLFHLPFNLGHTLLPLFAYYLRNWRYLQFSYSIFSVIYLTYVFVIYESPRWLFSIGRVEKAAAVLTKIAKWNRMPTAGIYPRLKHDYERTQKEILIKRGSLIDLFGNSFLCAKTLILFYEWISGYILFFGVIQFIAEQDGNKFLHVSISGILGLLATIISIFATKYLGRHLSLIILTLMCAICFLLIAIAITVSKVVVICLAFIGVFGSSAICTVLYLYSGEIYPTVVRSSGLGLCISFGRIGSMITPFITRDLSEKIFFLPPLIFSVFAFGAFGLAFQLPETRDLPVLNRLEDVNSFNPQREQASEAKSSIAL